MKTNTQIALAVLAGAALNVGLAATNLHPVNHGITAWTGIDTTGPIELPQVDLTETALATVGGFTLDVATGFQAVNVIPGAVAVGAVGAVAGIF